MPPERCMDPVRLRGISYKRFQSAGDRSFKRNIAANQGKGVWAEWLCRDASVHAAAEVKQEEEATGNVADAEANGPIKTPSRGVFQFFCGDDGTRVRCVRPVCIESMPASSYCCCSG